MTDYEQTEALDIPPRARTLRERLPSWTQRWGSRWLIGGAIAAVLLLCCCCGGALLLGKNLAGDHNKDHRPASEHSAKPSTSDRAVSSRPAPKTSTFDAPSSQASPAFGRVTVPSVVGKNAAVAKDELQRAGLTKIQFASGDPKHRLVLLPQNWEVKTQSASPGSNVEAGAVFVLTCTKLA